MSEMNQNNNGTGKGRDPFDRELRIRRRTWRTLRDFREGLQHALPVLPQPGYLDDERCRLADRR